MHRASGAQAGTVVLEEGSRELGVGVGVGPSDGVQAEVCLEEDESWANSCLCSLVLGPPARERARFYTQSSGLGHMQNAATENMVDGRICVAVRGACCPELIGKWVTGISK